MPYHYDGHTKTTNVEDKSKGGGINVNRFIPTTDCTEINQEKVAIAKKSTSKLRLRYFKYPVSLLSKF